ncbi:MAG: hypothetical protein CMG55_10355 [Candidatus Marinimicrobia bacterium]|nr:hypothetical protein [Candidatus Neomarinimicrobiota bacterium]|tara:strand:- start:4966 stop:5385 length:420 start_codon:yes stop_codon:yes gene_type:complete
MREKYDWVDRTLFILFSYAHITDWELADSERSLIQSKTRYIFKIINGDLLKYPPDIIEKKMIKAYQYWYEVQEESLDEVLSELQEVAAQIKFQNWFDSDFADKLIGFLGEIAKADGVVLDSEKFTLVDLANLWDVKPHL